MYWILDSKHVKVKLDYFQLLLPYCCSAIAHVHCEKLLLEMMSDQRGNCYPKLFRELLRSMRDLDEEKNF